MDFYLDEIKAYKDHKAMDGQSWDQVSTQLYNDEKLEGRINEFDASNIVNLQINSATTSIFYLKDGGSNYLTKSDGSSENLKHYWGGAFDSGTGSVYRDGSLYYSTSGKFDV